MEEMDVDTQGSMDSQEEINQTIQCTIYQTTQDDQLSKNEKGAIIVENIKQLQDIDPNAGTEVMINDSNNLKALADYIGKGMFDGSVASIPVNSKQILQMILQTVDKRCGDEITKNKFHEIDDIFEDSPGKDFAPSSFEPVRGTIRLKWDRSRGLTANEEYIVAKRLKIDIRKADGRKKFEDMIMEMTDEQFEEVRAGRKRKSYTESKGTEQNVDNNTDQAVINRDENEQTRILQKFLEFVNQNEDPLSYWELVVSDSFSETIENIFYVSFLLKEGVLIVYKSEDWGYEIVVPDYDRIENKSKWSRKSTAANKRKRLKFEASKTTRERAKKYIAEAMEQKEEFRQRDETKRINCRKEGKAGTNKRFSRNGVVSMTPKQWRTGLEMLIKSAKERDDEWQKIIPTRPFQQ